MFKNEIPTNGADRPRRIPNILEEGSNNIQNGRTSQEKQSPDKELAQILKGDSREANGFFTGEIIEIE